MTKKDFWKWSPDVENTAKDKLSALGMDAEAMLLPDNPLSDDELLKRAEDHWNELTAREQDLILQLGRMVS